MVWILSLALFVLLGLYVLVLVYISSHWKTEDIIDTPTSEGVSIIISARNEEQYIEACLEQCLNQNTSFDYQVIVVNDGSDDRTLDILLRLSNVYVNLDVINNEFSQGKKASLKLAISRASYDRLLFTDADCLPSFNWVHSMNSKFESDNLKLLAGPVEYIGTSTSIERFQYLDGINNMAMTNAGIKAKHFYSANGANLMYSKEVFYELDGYDGNEQFASGDDVFFMQKVANTYPDAIDFCMNANAIVRTYPEYTLKELINQRKRWATKTQGYSHMGIVLLQGVVFLFVLALCSAFLLIPFFTLSLTAVCFAVLLTKMIVDFIYLKKVNLFFGGDSPFQKYIGSFFNYLIYILLAGFYAVFPSSYEWKGRKVK